MAATEEAAADETSKDRAPLRCTECGGPFRYDEDGDVDCMCSEPETPPSERLACHRCEGPVAFNSDLDTDPMDCNCPLGEEPDSYYIMSRDESLDRVNEFL